jgi:chloride channel protein, CIC family
MSEIPSKNFRLHGAPAVSLAHRKAKALGIKLRAAIRGNEFFLIPVALVIGAFTGIAVTLMSQIAQLAHVLIYGIRIDVRLSANDVINPWVAIVALAAGGLILGLMEWSRRRWKISNATDPVEANALRGGRLSLRDSIVVSGQTLISNGCGASVGLEAGYTQIGAGVASLLGRILNLRRNDLRLMVGCGAAAAIAGAFGAPLTGAFYAFELIVGVYSVSSAAPILAASISAAYMARWLGGAPYSLDFVHVSPITLKEYLCFIVLALIISVVGIAIMRAAPYFERVFNQRFLPVWIRPSLGGVCVGALAIVTPQVLAAGHGAMILDLPRDMSGLTILAIIGLKLCACLISLASGFRGGLFFASLFVGCLIGKCFAVALQQSFLNLGIDAMASALTGMACLGVAIVGGPLTMSFLVLEMTSSLEVTAGVLAACIVTSVFVRAVFGHSFSTWRLHLRGETIRGATDVGWLRNLIVERLMRTDVAVARSDMPIEQCRREYPLGSSRALFLLNDKGEYVGQALLPDIHSSDFDAQDTINSVGDLAKLQDVMLTPSMNVKAAMKYFENAEAEILVVVDSMERRKVIGFLTEGYARRRYFEELDQASAGLLG